MTVLTISGQIGSGAREIGRLAAERLQLDYVDQQILVEAARTLGVTLETVASHDERTSGLGERVATMLRRFLERSAAAGAADPTLGAGGLDLVLSRTYGEAATEGGLRDVPDEQYISTLTGVIRDVAAHGDVAIVGRGSQVILRDWPGATHVLIVAPLDQRIDATMRRDDCSREEAERHVHEGDRGRLSFHEKFFKVNADDPAHYHLTLNSALLPPDEAARVIQDVAGRVAAGGPA